MTIRGFADLSVPPLLGFSERGTLNLSDNSNCLVAHLDKTLPNGSPTHTYETRGTLKKLLPTCQQPSAQAAARMQGAQKKAGGRVQGHDQSSQAGGACKPAARRPISRRTV
jgi:hypothetical protein